MSAAEDKSDRGAIPRAEIRAGTGSNLALGFDALVVLTVGFLLALFKIQNLDIWWHLKTGELIWASKAIQFEDVFSHTATGLVYPPTHWLFQVGAFLMQRATGFTGLVTAKAIIIACAFTIVFVAARRRGGSQWALAVVVAALIMSRFRFYVRPHIFTMLMLAFWVLLVEEAILSRRRWLLVFLPISMLLWANLHAGALFGLAFLGLATVGLFLDGVRERLRNARNKEEWEESSAKLSAAGLNADPVTERGQRLAPLARRRDAVALGVAFAASVGAILVNPNKAAILTYFLKHVSIYEQLDISEFRYASWSTEPIYFVFLGLTVLLFLIRWRRTRLVDLLPVLAFAYAGWHSIRLIPLFAIVATPTVAGYLHGVWSRLGRAPEETHRVGGDVARQTRGASAEASLSPRPHPAGRRSGWPGLVLDIFLWMGALAAALWVVFGSSTGRFASWSFGAGVNWDRYPANAVEYLESSGIQGTMYNSARFGGYLIWRTYPDRQVFVDGRLQLYDQVYEDIFNLSWARLVEKYGVEYTVTEFGEDIPIGPDLKLVYWDDVALVCLRPLPQYEETIERDQYQYTNPTFDIQPFAPHNVEGAVEEFKRALANAPSSSRARVYLGRTLLAAGAVEEAIDTLHTVVELFPQMVTPRLYLGVAYREAGAYDLAADLFEGILEAYPERADVLSHLGLTLYEMGEYERGLSLCREAVNLGPQAAAPHKNLGLVLMQEGELRGAVQQLLIALRRNPADIESRISLARILLYQGFHDQAVRHFDGVLTLDPNNVPAHRGMVEGYQALGREDLAKFHLRRIEELTPADSLSD